MDGILRESSDLVLFEAVHDNLGEFYDFLGQSLKASHCDSPYLSWLITGVPVSFLNVIFRTGLLTEEVEDTIADMKHNFASSQVSSFLWWLEPECSPENMAELLLSHGFTPDEFNPAMAADLQTLPTSPDLPDGVTIRPVETLDQLREWSNTLCAGFGLSESAGPQFFDLVSEQGLDLPVRYYTASLNGTPAATAMLLLSDSVAGIYCVTTRAEARGKGLGSALTHAAMLDARQIGYQYAVLQSSRMGYDIYRRLGFRDLGNMQCYVFSSD